MKINYKNKIVSLTEEDLESIRNMDSSNTLITSNVKQFVKEKVEREDA